MDFNSVASKWQKKWFDAKIWESNYVSGKESFFMIFAYPGVSGYLHVGHMRGFTYTDVITRFKRMQGFNVLFPVGTHASGNQAIAFANKVKKRDENWVNYLVSNGFPKDNLSELEDPFKVVNYFNKVYVEEYWKKFGFLADWNRFACTINEDYNKFIQWQFKKLNDLGLLVQKPYFAPFCPVHGPVAVDASETDISKGGKAEKNEYTLLKFKFKDMFLIAATLRPETVFGQTNLWINPETTYSIVLVNGEKWVVSSEAAEKLKYQKESVEVIGSVNGKELIGLKAVAPMIHRELIILPSSFCDSNVGTGIVTSVPSDAPDDWMGLNDLKNSKKLCEEHGLNWSVVNSIQPIPIIRTPGYSEFPARDVCEKLGVNNSMEREKLVEAKHEVYSTGFFKGVMLENSGKYAGLKVQVAKEKVKQDLIDSGEASVFYDFSEEVLCRCGRKIVIKKIDDQWFIKYSSEDLTIETKKHVESMSVYPKEFHNNLPGILDWFQDRACARLGNWLGTKLPFDDKWVIEPISDSTLYPIYYLISKYVNSNKLTVNDLTEEFFDFVFLDSRKKPSNISEELLVEIKREVNHFLPLNVNLGGKEHQTVHFPVFLMNHVAVLPKKFWPKGIFVNWWVIGKGSKISKSKGGAEPIPNAIKEYSVDAMRLYYANIGSSFTDVVWDVDKAKNYKKTLEKIVTLAQELMQFSEVDNNFINDWIREKTNSMIFEVTSALNEFDFRIASEKIYYNFVNDLKWFLKRGGKDKDTIQFVLKQWFKLMNPITPHLSEELNELLGGKEFVSTSEWPVSSTINPQIIEGEKLVQTIIEDVKRISEIANITSLKGVRVFITPDWKWSLIQKISKELTAPDFGKAMKIASASTEAKEHKKDLPKFVKSILKKLPEFKGKQKLDEYNMLNNAKQFLEKELNTQVFVLKASEATGEETLKASNALPLKPAILLK